MSNEALQNQIFIYSIDTGAFYNKSEMKIYKEMMYFIKRRNAITGRLTKKKYQNKLLKNNKDITKSELRLKTKEVTDQMQLQYQPMIDSIRDILKKKIAESSFEETRELQPEFLKDNKLISIFESSLTRICGFKKNQKTEDLIVVKVYHYNILKSLIHNGFMFKGEKYIYYSSSAGQIRTKKVVMIKESLFKRIEKRLTCGLDLDTINNTVVNKERNESGINPNKYQAYLALTNSASIKWRGFNIDRTVVVKDMETSVFSEVDYIDTETYDIQRKEMEIEIPHTDGCGMMLPKVSKKAFMYRLPFHKGLLVPFPFDKFCENHGITEIKDIYGKSHKLKDVDVIFTESQFKMWKYYNSWTEYQENFKKYKCEAVKLNEEHVSDFANLNYQMLQTLTDITEEELDYLVKLTNEDLTRLATDKDKMLEKMGAIEGERLNFMQKSLLLYPELLNDSYSKSLIREIKRNLAKDGRAGKLRVNGKYTFLIPDLYAFCEFLFLNQNQPKGLLENQEVYCSIFEEGKVDILRSPHLYREHGVRNNVVNKDNLSDWFISKGIYTSVHDPISRILQFDKSHCRLA